MTPEQIRATQAKRFAYLVFVYDQWQRVSAGHLQSLPATVVHEHIGIDRQEGDRIEEYLKGRGLIKYVTMGPTVAITTYGIEYVEQALAEPDEPTEFFPAVNVLHIEQVINSQIQQGTTHSQQTRLSTRQQVGPCSRGSVSRAPQAYGCPRRERGLVTASRPSA